MDNLIKNVVAQLGWLNSVTVPLLLLLVSAQHRVSTASSSTAVNFCAKV